MKKNHTKSILVVEDEPYLSEICSRVLTEDGYHVDIAPNSQIASKILQLQEYDLYLIDIRTPEMNGLELYQWMNENNPRLARRIIFTGGYPYERDGNETLASFEGQFLPKPFSPSELRETVREFFGQII